MARDAFSFFEADGDKKQVVVILLLLLLRMRSGRMRL
jgi:hypothetical protein